MKLDLLFSYVPSPIRLGNDSFPDSILPFITSFPLLITPSNSFSCHSWAISHPFVTVRCSENNEEATRRFVPPLPSVTCTARTLSISITQFQANDNSLSSTRTLHCQLRILVLLPKLIKS
jgi:hypothetical protein